MEEPRTLMCYRVEDVDPKAQSVVDQCVSCKKAVWRALSNPPCDRVLCMQCGFAEMPKDAKIEPPTKEQIEEARWWYLNFGGR